MKPHGKQSHRVPGAPYRRIGVHTLTKQDEETMHKMEVHGDALGGTPARTSSSNGEGKINPQEKSTPIL